MWPLCVAGEGAQLLFQEDNMKTPASVSMGQPQPLCPLRQLLRAQHSGLLLALQPQGANSFLLLQDPGALTLGFSQSQVLILCHASDKPFSMYLLFPARTKNAVLLKNHVQSLSLA